MNCAAQRLNLLPRIHLVKYQLWLEEYSLTDGLCWSKEYAIIFLHMLFPEMKEKGRMKTQNQKNSNQDLM